MELFYDSYALYSIMNGEESYLPYSKSMRVLTSIMNLYETYYHLIKDNRHEQADIFLEKFMPYCVPLYSAAIKDAAQFRLAHTKLDISFIDALGYILAKHHHVRFLTGDKAFKNLGNVEFVK